MSFCLGRVQHTAPQSRCDAKHQFDAMTVRQIVPQRHRIGLTLHRHPGGKTRSCTAIVEKHPLEFMPTPDHSGCKPGGRDIGMASVRRGEYEEGVFHFQVPANKKPRCEPGFLPER